MASASLKFYLESKVKGDSKKLLPIFLYIRHKGTTLKVYTERKCHWHGWDVSKCRAVPRRFPGSTELNSLLGELEAEALSLYNSNLRKGVLTTKSDILNLIAEISGQNINRITFLEFADDYLEKAKLAENTRRAYKTTLNIITEYSSQKRKTINFQDIDLNFYDSFTDFMWKEKHFNDNTVGKVIKNIKSLMNQAFERDLHNNLSYKKKGFRVYHKSADTIYLSENELDKILAKDLSKNPRLEKVRDIFYVACWLGLRFSDMLRVSKDKFTTENGINIFRIESEKTNEVVKIPVIPKLKPILKKYDYNLPAISNQKLNDYLKDLGEEAEINEEIEVTDYRGGNKVRTTFPKYDLITTHTARRSFATNLYLQGVPTQSIMAVTGHKTESSFMAYLKITHMQKIKQIDQHFKKSNRKKKKQKKQPHVAA
jgi:integrase